MIQPDTPTLTIGQRALTLREHLSKSYDHTLHHNFPGALETFIAAAQDEPDLLAQAKARLTELTDDVCMRCYTSSIHRKILQHVISEVEGHAR